MLARGQTRQSARSGTLLQRGRGRCVAFPLFARQRAIDLDARASVYRFCIAFTRIAGKNKEEQTEMGFFDHIEELRWHIMRSVFAWLVAATSIFIYVD